VLEVGHHQFAQSAIDGLAVAQTGIVGLGDRTPATIPAIHGQDVIVVADRLQIDQQRWIAEHPQRRGGEHSALHAVRCAVAQHAPGRPARWPIRLFVVGNLVIQELRDFFWSAQAAEAGALARVEWVGHGR